MSAGAGIARDDAMALAQQLRDLLADHCDRIEIAGSLRRDRLIVHDIELVAIPRLVPAGLFGDAEPFDALEAQIEHLLMFGGIEARQVENHRADGTIDTQTKLGPAFKALVFGGIPVDLFIVRPPATWGVIFGLRTGPGDWNVRLVMDCQRHFRRVAGGQVLHFGKPVPTPEEADFFAAIGQPWVPPAERAVDRVRITQPSVAAEGA